MRVHVGIKGSSESGNYGHAGRPGIVGGSAAGGKVAIATYEWLKDQPFANADVDKEDEYLRDEWGVPRDINVLPYDKGNTDRMLTAISKCSIPQKHLQGLHYLVAFTPGENVRCIGFQNAHDESDSVIGLRKNQEFAPVAAHEVGHHIMDVLKPAKIGSAGLVMQRILGNLRDYGLRKRSLSDASEFVADTYKIALLAKPNQRNKLLDLWNKVTGDKFSNLLDIFEV